MTKKSFELVVDLDAAYTPGETIRKAEPSVVDLVKSAKIERIKGILRARGRA